MSEVKGHHYNRTIRTLKLVYEALTHLHWKCFGEYLEEVQDHDIDLELILEKVLDMHDEIKAEEANEFLDTTTMNKLFQYLQEFRQSNRGPMFTLWTSFLEMVGQKCSFEGQKCQNLHQHFCWLQMSPKVIWGSGLP